jgi:hypothetical protein
VKAVMGGLTAGMLRIAQRRVCAQCVLVKGWKSTASWGFPKGKINLEEEKWKCAVREVRFLPVLQRKKKRHAKANAVFQTPHPAGLRRDRLRLFSLPKPGRFHRSHDARTEDNIVHLSRRTVRHGVPDEDEEGD